MLCINRKRVGKSKQVRQGWQVCSAKQVKHIYVCGRRTESYIYNMATYHMICVTCNSDARSPAVSIIFNVVHSSKDKCAGGRGRQEFIVMAGGVLCPMGAS